MPVHRRGFFASILAFFLPKPALKAQIAQIPQILPPFVSPAVDPDIIQAAIASNQKLLIANQNPNQPWRLPITYIQSTGNEHKVITFNEYVRLQDSQDSQDDKDQVDQGDPGGNQSGDQGGNPEKLSIAHQLRQITIRTLRSYYSTGTPKYIGSPPKITSPRPEGPK